MDGADVSLGDAAKQRGNAHFTARRYRDAVREYTDAVNVEPTNSPVLLNRAAAYMALGEFAPALSDCQRAVQLQGDSATGKALIRLAKCYLCLGDTSSADRILGCVSIGPQYSEADRQAASDQRDAVHTVERHIVTYWAYREQKEWSLAGFAIDQAQSTLHLSDYNTPILWRMLKAFALLHKGALGECQTIAMEVFRSDPSNTEAMLICARAMLAGNDPAKALAQTQAALRIDPDNAAAKRFLKKCRTLQTLKDEANAAFRTNNEPEALSLYGKALEVARENNDEDAAPRKFNAVVYSNRAILFSRMGRHPEAIDDCTEALRFDPAYGKPLRTRARAYMTLEKYEEAVRDFKKAYDVATSTAEADSLRREIRQAEIELKRSKNVDFYRVLGVSRSASGPEIKKAFRRESLKHHPDKGGDEEKFKLCNEAYSVLSDDTKRRQYDAGGDDILMDYGMDGMSSMSGMGGMGGVNLADLFASAGMGSGMRFQTGPSLWSQGGPSPFMSGGFTGVPPGFEFRYG